MEFVAHIREFDNKIQTVFEHSVGTADMASLYCAKIGAPLCGYLMGLLHDVGKYSQDFQKRINENGDICDHATAGAIFLYESSKKIHSEETKIVLKAMAFASMCHHGGLRDFFNYNKNTDYFESRISNTQLFDNIKESAKEILTIAEKHIESEEFVSECKKLFHSIKNNITTYDKKSRGVLSFEIGLLIKFFYSSVVDADRKDTIEFQYGKTILPDVCWKKLSLALDNKVNSFKQNKLSQVRKEIYERCAEKGKGDKGLYALKVQTGGGKTLSSFRFAVNNVIQNKMDRIIYILPFISIIEQNAEVIRKLLSEARIDTDVLEESHSSVVFKEDEADFNKNLKRRAMESNWDSKIVFSTMVGFLESIYGDGTQGVRRFHNLANSVIIFDEIQALPLKCVCIFNLLIRFLVEQCGATVLLCSATQPLLDRIGNSIGGDKSKKYSEFQIKAPQNIIPNIYESLERTQLIYENTALSYDAIAERIMKSLDETNNVLLVVNTKKSAENMYERMVKTGIKVFYLSTNLCAEHRSSVIDNIKKAIANKEKFLCVSTQLIEAGVDLDFDCAYRFLSGLDSIIQTAGRCNREGNMKDKNGEPTMGKVYIVDCNEENLGSLNEIKESQKETRATYYDNLELTEQSIINYYLRRFANIDTGLKYSISKPIKTNMIDLLGCNRKILHDRQMYPGQSFKTAGENFAVIDSRQTSVLVPYREGKKLIEKLVNKSGYVSLRQCNRYFVNFYENDLIKMKGIISEIDGVLYL